LNINELKPYGRETQLANSECCAGVNMIQAGDFRQGNDSLVVRVY